MLLANEGVSTTDEEQAKGSKGSKFKGEDLVKSFMSIHEMCSEKDAAPRRYMTFLKNYKAIFNGKRDGVVKRQQHLQVCLLTRPLDTGKCSPTWRARHFISFVLRRKIPSQSPNWVSGFLKIVKSILRVTKKIVMHHVITVDQSAKNFTEEIHRYPEELKLLP